MGPSHEFVEATEGRTQPTIDFVAGLDADLLCVQEAWFATQELIDASAEKLPNTVFIPNDVGMTGDALCTQAQVIARAAGGRGPNRDYLVNTAAHLHELGLPDAELDWLVARVAELAPA